MRLLRLADHLHYCAIGEDRIFLDLRADRYFALPPAARQAFRALEAGGPAPAGDPGIEALVRTGILVDAPLGKPIAPTGDRAPTDSLPEAGRSAKGSVGALVEVLLLVAAARRAVRALRLPRLLPRLSRRSARLRPRALDRDRAVARFRAVRPFVPIAPNCLYDSIALLRFLQRRGIAAQLVIGVKLHPFAAHAWVQDGATILNDALAHARDFQPVLVA